MLFYLISITSCTFKACIPQNLTKKDVLHTALLWNSRVFDYPSSEIKSFKMHLTYLNMDDRLIFSVIISATHTGLKRNRQYNISLALCFAFYLRIFTDYTFNHFLQNLIRGPLQKFANENLTWFIWSGVSWVCQGVKWIWRSSVLCQLEEAPWDKMSGIAFRTKWLILLTTFSPDKGTKQAIKSYGGGQ